LSNGPVGKFASQAGALLTFVVSGELELVFASGEGARLEPGDMVLIDEEGVSKTSFVAANDARLIQLGVAPDWPGDAGQEQGPGTIVARQQASNIKRIYTGDDQRSQFSEFGKLFSAPEGEWAAGKHMEGFRFLSWEDGLLDWHPGVINQIAIFLSGEIEVEVGGGGGETQFFYAGDVCICEDRTGEGHVDRVRGLAHIILLEVANQHLW
jgi:mannose-6-phosphate isomerase-like protein (cupin superfamily)